VVRTDPNGQFWWIVIGAIIGGINADRNGGNFWTGAFVGAVSGAISWGVSSAFSGILGESLTTSVLSGAVGGGLTSSAFGGDFWEGAGQGALAGAIAWGVDSYIGKGQKWYDKGFFGGLKGGFNAIARGGNFFEGFASGFGGSLQDSLASAAGDSIDKYINRDRVRWDIDGYYEVYYSHENDTIYWVDSQGKIIKSWKCSDEFVKGYDKETKQPRASLPDGDYTFTAGDVGTDHGISYGTFYIDTGDPRGRDIHGGGSGLSTEKTRNEDFMNKEGAYAPRQGWVKTYGCLRMQNADGEALSRLIIKQGNTVPAHVCSSIVIKDGWIMGYSQKGIGITRFTGEGM
jgi:hypothetical protein